MNRNEENVNNTTDAHFTRTHSWLSEASLLWHRFLRLELNYKSRIILAPAIKINKSPSYRNHTYLYPWIWFRFRRKYLTTAVSSLHARWRHARLTCAAEVGGARIQRSFNANPKELKSLIFLKSETKRWYSEGKKLNTNRPIYIYIYI